MQNLFLGGLKSSNSNVEIVNSLNSGFSGDVEVDLDNDTATIDGTVYNLNRDGNVLSFGSDTDFSGLVIDDKGQTGSLTLNISSGLRGSLQIETDKYLGISGIISSRTERIDDSNRRLDRDLESAQDRLEDERARLTQIFSRAEQAISQLQGLQASLAAQQQG